MKTTTIKLSRLTNAFLPILGSAGSVSTSWDGSFSLERAMRPKLTEEERREHHRQASKRYRRKHPKKIAEYMRWWYAKNPKRAARKHWKEEHREECMNYRRKYEAKHPERYQKSCRRYWRTANGKAAMSRSQAKRRAALKSVDCTLTAKEWQAILKVNNHRCFYCGKKFKTLEMDHVIPLSKGGKHVRKNIVPACRSCNAKKHNKLLVFNGFGLCGLTAL